MKKNKRRLNRRQRILATAPLKVKRVVFKRMRAGVLNKYGLSFDLIRTRHESDQEFRNRILFYIRGR